MQRFKKKEAIVDTVHTLHCLCTDMHITFQISDVRLKCVLGLQGLYGDPLLLPKLDLFTSRFKVNTSA